MALDANDKPVIRTLDCLDQTLVRARRHDEAGRYITHRLMVKAVDPSSRTVESRTEARGRIDGDGVSQKVPSKLADLVAFFTGPLRRNILVERPSGCDRQELDAAADAENGHAVPEGVARQRELEIISCLVDRAQGRVSLFTVLLGSDVDSAREQKPIEQTVYLLDAPAIQS
jgi:hypothetical protein